jgi:hypothetical protein
LANFLANSAYKFSSAEKFGTISASSNYTEKKQIHTNVANSWQIFQPIRWINFAQLKNSAPSLPAQTIQRKNKFVTMLPTLGKVSGTFGG